MRIPFRPIAIFAAALLTRTTYLLTLVDSPFFAHPRLDALFHDLWALSIAGGNVIGDHIYFRAPFYPYFLGAVYALFGHDYLIARVIQFLLGSSAAVLLYFLGRRVIGEKVAFWASLLFAVYPVEIYFEGELLLESILGFLCLLFLLLSYRASGRLKTRSLLFAGFSLGILAITRPPLIPAGIAFFFLLLALPSTGHTGLRLEWRSLVVFLSALLFPILTVTVRNYVIGNDVVIIASQGGVNFYIGNIPDATGYTSSLPEASGIGWENRDATYMVEKQLGHAPKPSEESAFWYRKALGFITSHPLDFLALLLRKAYLFWNDYEIPNNQSYEFAREQSLLLRSIPISFGIIAPFGIVGMVLSWKNRRLRALTIFIGVYFTTAILFFVCDRYRVPLFPLLCLLAVFAVSETARAIGSRDYRRSGLIAAGLVVTGFFCNSSPGIEGTGLARDTMASGIAELEAGKFEAARKNFATTDSLTPGFPNLRVYIAALDWAEGRERESIASLRQEFAANQESYPAVINLALIYYKKGSLDSALYFGQKALERKPYVPAGYTVTAQALLRMERYDEANRILEQGTASCTGDFAYGECLLAGIRLKEGDAASAERKYRAVLNQLSDHPQPMYEPEFSFTEEGKIGHSTAELRGKALYGIGSVRVSRGQIDSAVTYFRLSTSVSPTNSDAWADLGVALLRRQDYKGAAAALSTAIAADSTNSIYWFNLGVALLNSSNRDGARDAFRKSLNLQPSFQPAREAVESLK